MNISFCKSQLNSHYLHQHISYGTAGRRIKIRMVEFCGYNHPSSVAAEDTNPGVCIFLLASVSIFTQPKPLPYSTVNKSS